MSDVKFFRRFLLYLNDEAGLAGHAQHNYFVAAETFAAWPAEPEVVYRVFHRMVKADPPTTDDFLSNKAKGLPPRGAEVGDPSLWDGISVMDAFHRACKHARQFPQHGVFIAALHIPPGRPAHCRAVPADARALHAPRDTGRSVGLRR